MTNFILTVLGIIIPAITAFIIYLFQRSRKELAYEILSVTPILSNKPIIDGSLEISFNGKILENAKLVIVKVFNSGNSPIRSQDFEKNLNLMIDNASVSLIAAEVSETQPENLDVNISWINHSEEDVEKSFLSVNPLLLNPKDSFELKLLVNQESNDGESDVTVIPKARIYGVKEIKQPRKYNILYYTYVLLGLLSVTFGAFSTIGTGLNDLSFLFIGVFAGVIFSLLKEVWKFGKNYFNS